MVGGVDIKKILINSGYKLTGPRLKVFNFLQKDICPISASALYKRLANVDKVSVYRVLNLFEQLNIVQCETVGKEKLYCLATDHPHHHIVCRKCGNTDSFECTGNEFKNFRNFTDIHHQLTLTGICNKCIDS